MTQRDNWGWQARIGMFIVGSEVVPEAEWWAMVPLNVSVHAARVTARAPWARWRDDRSGVELEDDLLRGCRQFAPMCLSAVVVGHSSSSILGGPQWDEAVVETLSRELGGGVAVTSNGLDCAAALQASGVNRPFLVFPLSTPERTVRRLCAVSRRRQQGPWLVAGTRRAAAFVPGPTRRLCHLDAR
jgi:maleate isomerase